MTTRWKQLHAIETGTISFFAASQPDFTGESWRAAGADGACFFFVVQLQMGWGAFDRWKADHRHTGHDNGEKLHCKVSNEVTMNSKTRTRSPSRRLAKDESAFEQSGLNRNCRVSASSAGLTPDALDRPSENTEFNSASDTCPCSFGRHGLLDLLNGVLEDVRAEAQMSSNIETLDVHREHRALFRHLRTEQIRSIVLLLREIERLNGQPSVRTSPLGDRPPRGAPVSVHLRCFSDRQRSFHERLDEALPRVAEARLQEVLSDLQKRHTQCIERCTALTDSRWIGRERGNDVCERPIARTQCNVRSS